MMLTIESPTTEQERDLAACDAHLALRSALLPHILRRPDAAKIVEKIRTGAELSLDYAPGPRIVAASMIDSRSVCIMRGSLADDAATAELFDALRLALAASLNREEPERKQAVATAVAAGADFVCSLRLIGSIEALTLALVLDGRMIWSVTREQAFDPEHCLTRPALH